MPREVFLTLEHYLAEKGAVDDVSRTKCRCTLTGHQGLEDIFKELSSESPVQASVDEDIIVKRFRGGGYSRLEISGEKPIVLLLIHYRDHKSNLPLWFLECT